MMTERLTDPLDYATEYAERERQAAIDRARQQPPGQPTRDDCIKCGNDIEPGRQAALAGVQTCIECARYAER